MKKLILISAICSNLLFGAESPLSYADKIYANQNDFNINQECKPTCRTVQAGYKTKVVDFNPFSGVTKCIITIAGADESNNFNFTADTVNQQCINDTSKKVDVSTLASYNKTFNSNVSLKYEERGTLTLSKLLAAIATLDDDIINIPQTVETNNLTLKGGN